MIALAFLTSEARGQQTNEISLWHVMGGPLRNTVDSLLAKFQREQGIRVRAINMGNYTALSQKLMAAAMAGNLPELSQSYEAWTSQLLEKGVLAPFGDYVSGPEGIDTAELADVFPVMIQECSRDGRLVTLPFNKSVPVFYYNRDLFIKAGLDPDRFPETWEDFIEAAGKLTRDDDGDGKADTWGLAFPINSLWLFQCLLLQNNTDVFDSSGRAIFDCPQGVEALQFMADLVHKYKIAYLTTGFEHQNDFLAGRLGMIQGSSASLAYLSLQKIPFSMGIAPLPGWKRRAVVLSGTNLVMFRKNAPEIMESAWKLAKFLIATDNTARWSAETSYLPVRRSALDHPLMIEKFKKFPGLKKAYLQIEYAYPEPRDVAWLTGRAIVEEEALQPALLGLKSPDEVLHHAATKINHQYGHAQSNPWISMLLLLPIIGLVAIAIIKK